MDQVRTAEMSWRQVDAAIGRGAAAIFPLGSTEEHGPHAATGDYLIAEEVAVRTARQSGHVAVPCGPPFGDPQYFRKFPVLLPCRVILSFTLCRTYSTA